MRPKKLGLRSNRREGDDLHRRLDHHFLTCSAVAGAAMLLASRAEAAIVYSGVKNVPVPATKGGLSIDLDTGAFSTTDELAGFDLNLSINETSSSLTLNFTGGTAPGDEAITVSSSNTSPIRFAKGAVVEASASGSNLAHGGALGSSSSGEPSGPWKPGDTGYLGFKFVSAANTTLYGWAQLAIGPKYSATVIDWAYEDSGANIIAGQTNDFAVAVKVPQPNASASGAPAEIVVKRKGGKDLPLNVKYKVLAGSTAVSGKDYTALSGTIVIPAGEKKATLSIQALPNPARVGTRKLKLKVIPGLGYTVSEPRKAVVSIGD